MCTNIDTTRSLQSVTLLDKSIEFSSIGLTSNLIEQQINILYSRQHKLCILLYILHINNNLETQILSRKILWNNEMHEL